MLNSAMTLGEGGDRGSPGVGRSMSWTDAGGGGGRGVVYGVAGAAGRGWRGTRVGRRGWWEERRRGVRERSWELAPPGWALGLP